MALARGGAPPCPQDRPLVSARSLPPLSAYRRFAFILALLLRAALFIGRRGSRKYGAATLDSSASAAFNGRPNELFRREPAAIAAVAPPRQSRARREEERLRERRRHRGLRVVFAVLCSDGEPEIALFSREIYRSVALVSFVQRSILIAACSYCTPDDTHAEQHVSRIGIPRDTVTEPFSVVAWSGVGSLFRHRHVTSPRPNLTHRHHVTSRVAISQLLL